MNNKIAKIIFSTLLCFIGTQTAHAGFGPFMAYHTDLYFSKRWGFHFDMNTRIVNDQMGNNPVFVFRAAALYRLNPQAEKFKMTLSAGAAIRGTVLDNALIPDVYGVPIGISDALFQENILYQQLGIQHQIAKPFSLEHRLRLEEVLTNTVYFENNLSGNNTPVKYQQTNLRYLIRPELTLFSKSDMYSLHLAVQEEFFVRMHSDFIKLRTVAVTENRFSAHFGIKVQSHTKIELGYMHMSFNLSDKSPQTNHMLHFQVLQSLNFFK